MSTMVNWEVTISIPTEYSGNEWSKCNSFRTWVNEGLGIWPGETSLKSFRPRTEISYQMSLDQITKLLQAIEYKQELTITIRRM